MGIQRDAWYSSRWARTRLLAGLIAAVVLALAPAAGAQIVIGRAIGPVRLGESQEQLHQALGAPHRLYCWSGSGTSCRWQEADYLQPTASSAAVEQVLLSRSGRVIDILTGRGNQRTRRGARVGSSQGQIRAAYPSVACAAQECVLIARRVRTAAVTTFFLTGRRVMAVEVAQADRITVSLTPPSVHGSPSSPWSATAIITVTDAAGSPELGAVPQLVVTAGAGGHVGSIAPLGGLSSSRYAVRVTWSASHGPVTITATFHWGPPALRRVLGISATTVLRRL